MISTIFFISLIIFVLALLGVLLNFRGIVNTFTDSRMGDPLRSMKGNILLHVVFGGIASISGLATVISGTIWIIKVTFAS